MTAKKILIMALLWGGLFPGVLFAGTGAEGYGCARWGMSLDGVKACLQARECTMISTEPALLMCEDTVADEGAFIGYRFNNNALYQVRILFNVEAVKSQTYLEKYAKLEKYLENTYGKPQQKDRKTMINPFEDDARQIATGRGYYQTFWKTQATEILLSLRGENNKLVLSIQYSDTAYLRENAGEKPTCQRVCPAIISRLQQLGH